MSEIELRGVSKVFGGDVVAVDDVSLTVGDGELVVFVGPSGSGKSTTLRMIAGLESPTEGDILIDGERVNEVEPQDRDIAMVFQSFALYPHRSVRGNLAFPLEARSLDDAEVDERVEEAARILGISDLLDRKPSQLSGGQQQRVALGRAIVRDPRAFLMDEPLANLDAKLRTEMRTEVVSIQQDLGVTMVHVTHNQEEAMTMGDRVVVMDGGEVQQIAPPKETYRRPANRFVAEFIGSPSMNLLDGTVEGGSFAADRGDVSVELPAGYDEFSGRATLGIRPENVDLVEEPGEHTFTATVELIELLGNVQIVHFDLGGQQFLAELHPDVAVEQGETRHVRVAPDRAHLFDGVSPRSERVVPGDVILTD
jgi:multiple sugar transport system ATP-binding protein